MIEHDKVYETVIKLGMRTDTGDREGIVTEKHSVDSLVFNEDKINNVLKSFVGKQSQTPPKYSAIKVKREKAV